MNIVNPKDPSLTTELATVLVSNKLSMIRNYIAEIIIVALACSVFYLYKEQNRMQSNLIDFYKNDNGSAARYIMQNNSVIETNNVILRDLRQLMREISHDKTDSTSKW